MDILGKLFGSEHKVKIMRLFLFNPETRFIVTTIAKRTKANSAIVRRELFMLRQMKLIKHKSLKVKTAKGHKGKRKATHRSVSGFILNQSFPYLSELQRLLLDTSLLKGDEITRRLSPAGRLKLVIVSGLFIQDAESRLDLLVVGEHLKRSILDQRIKSMESEIGKELRYAAFETSEFNYRLGLFDKLIRDVLDFPHTVVFDRLGLPPFSIGR